MFDLLVAEFKDKLVAEINAAQLPPTIVSYVLQDVQLQVNALVQKQVEAQKQEREKTEQEAAETAPEATQA
jgi:hypothetical protein